MFTIVPTPIGNSGDITVRAEQALREAEVIFAEDPRVSGLLLQKLNLPTREFIRFGSEADYLRIPELISKNKDKNAIVVVDAGTPGISDPGWILINELQKQGILYTVLPGPSAVTTVAAASGLISQQFWFVGFLPLKKGRVTIWKNIAESAIPVVIYESVHRITKTLQEIKMFCAPDREVFIGRELSKLYEHYWRGTVSELEEYKLIEKGEFALVIGQKNKQ